MHFYFFENNTSFLFKFREKFIVQKFKGSEVQKFKVQIQPLAHQCEASTSFGVTHWLSLLSSHFPLPTSDF
jgi:hypothetical protein